MQPRLPEDFVPTNITWRTKGGALVRKVTSPYDSGFTWACYGCLSAWGMGFGHPDWLIEREASCHASRCTATQS